MMALNSGSNAESSSLPARANMVSKAHMRRRRSSKGTIAGFTFKGGDGQSPQGSSPDGSQAGNENAGSVANAKTPKPLTNSNQGSQPSHSSDSNIQAAPTKVCHSARLALLACQNAIRMGARTQLGLCPPGRSRRNLQAALRQRARANTGSHNALVLRSTSNATESGGNGGYFALEKMLGAQAYDAQLSRDEDFLMNATTFDVDSDEEASSGDEDELANVEHLLNEDGAVLDDEAKYRLLMEPLFTPIGADASSGASGGPMAALVNGGHGKLPFNRRKLRFFDSVDAVDRSAARQYLSKEARKSKQREVLLLTRHLRRMQKAEKQKVHSDRAGRLGDSDLSDQENDFEREKELASGGMSRFEQPMTPSIAAALLLESLSLNPVESLEGMGTCYEGIIHAGVAVLDLSMHDPSSSLIEQEKAPHARSEIIAALTMLLITSLEQPSGDVILSLAKLRRMCGTPRYQRRFVQRVAPALIRPPRGAMWCLRHQHDMEPILAAVELIFDCASEIFSKGWYERGQLLLADSKRAETLNTAAMQLRNLSSDPSDGLSLGLTVHGHSHGHSSVWRGNKFKAGTSHGKDGTKSSNSLAEWEVIALDRQIRVSITNIISTDWSTVAPTNENINRASSYHRSRSMSKRSSVILQSPSGELSPKGILSTPHSPARPTNAKTPNSPSNPFAPANSAGPPIQPDVSENFPVLPTGAAMDAERSSSPTPFTMPIKTSARPSKVATDNPRNVAPPEPPASALQLPASGSQPPPRSPRRDSIPDASLAQNNLTVTPESPTQKRADSSAQSIGNQRSKASPYGTTGKTPNLPSTDKERAPLSPSSPHLTPSTSDVTPYRPMSSGSSVASASSMGSHPANYRMLTSTAAERKRTVAACRALRSQITHFEDAFKQLHGRPPKGATERAPLASTYTQYREWKKAIRTDAACRIQALLRGFLTRRRLSRSNNPALSRIIMGQAGRSGAKAKERKESVLQQLSMPAEIGDPVTETTSRMSSASSVASANSSNSLRYDDDSSVNSSGSGIPRGNARRRLSDRPDGFPVSPASRPFPPQTGAAASASAESDLAHLPLPDLQAHKRDLKQQLKQYDMAFARRHGRMPVKAEKEPIRHLYETYNTLKGLITSREQDGPAVRSSGPVQPPPTRISPRTISPPPTHEPVAESGRPRGRRSTSGSSGIDPSASPPVPGPSSAAPDLPSLRSEKGRLHQMLRSYERDFYREHNRQVSSFADIRPVANQYRRYKEVKRAIATAQLPDGGDSEK